MTKFSNIISEFEQNKDRNLKSLDKIYQFLTDLAPYLSKVMDDYRKEEDKDQETKDLESYHREHSFYQIGDLFKYLELKNLLFSELNKKNQTIENHHKVFALYAK